MTSSAEIPRRHRFLDSMALVVVSLLSACWLDGALAQPVPAVATSH